MTSRRMAASLEAVLIGNAGAALQGAPVTTVDFDFLFRRTPRNLQKLKQSATCLGATVLRPYYPVSDLFRVVRDDGLQVDFMGTVHGLRSFAGVQSRATIVALTGASIIVASLGDIIRSKRAAGRPRDVAVIEMLEKSNAKAKNETASGDAPAAARPTSCASAGCSRPGRISELGESHRGLPNRHEGAAGGARLRRRFGFEFGAEVHLHRVTSRSVAGTAEGP